MKLAKPAVAVLIALSLAGCTAPATSTPTRSAAPQSSTSHVVTPTLYIADKLPSSCDAFYAGLDTFMSDDGSLRWRLRPLRRGLAPVICLRFRDRPLLQQTFREQQG